MAVTGTSSAVWLVVVHSSDEKYPVAKLARDLDVSAETLRKWVNQAEVDAGERDGLTTHRFKPLLRGAGLPQIRFHDLRHTCATLLLMKNVNPKVVSEMLGHATIAITLDTYSHVLPNMQESAAAAMEEVLS